MANKWIKNATIQYNLRSLIAFGSLFSSVCHVELGDLIKFILWFANGRNSRKFFGWEEVGSSFFRLVSLLHRRSVEVFRCLWAMLGTVTFQIHIKNSVKSLKIWWKSRKKEKLEVYGVRRALKSFVRGSSALCKDQK